MHSLPISAGWTDHTSISQAKGGTELESPIELLNYFVYMNKNLSAIFFLKHLEHKKTDWKME